MDAQAVRGALQKGRSSAGTLRHPIAQAGAIMLACNLRLRFAYLPSESNPADAPSRGVRVPRASRLKCKKSMKSKQSRDARAEQRATDLARVMAFNDDVFVKFLDSTVAGCSGGDSQSSL